VQEESLHVSKSHIWVNSDGDAEAAIMVTNNGGRDVVINKISVRGQQSDWTNVLYAVAADADNLSTDLNYVTIPVEAANNLGLVDVARQAADSLVLPSGETIVIYVNNPDSIGLNDIGLTVGLSLHSSQAVYYTELNIEATD